MASADAWVAFWPGVALHQRLVPRIVDAFSVCAALVRVELAIAAPKWSHERGFSDPSAGSGACVAEPAHAMARVRARRRPTT
eukprot:350853-Chlamydomonas_euryale.AAC.2